MAGLDILFYLNGISFFTTIWKILSFTSMGSWENDGLVTKNKTNTSIITHSYHLTSFALLVQINEFEVNKTLFYTMVIDKVCLKCCTNL